MTDFFISYTSVDRAWAEWIAWQLEAAGHTTIIQAWDFRPGSNFVLAMQQAAEAHRVVAVLSPDYLSAAYTQPEWAAAFAQDPRGSQGTLLPIRIRACQLPNLLRAIVYIDLVGLEEAAAKDALLVGIERHRAKPTVAPGFPGSTTTGRATPPYPAPALPPAIGGVHVSGGTIVGPIIGTNHGTINGTYNQGDSHKERN